MTTSHNAPTPASNATRTLAGRQVHPLGLGCMGMSEFYGLSEVSAQSLRAAHAGHPIAAVQTEYSLWERSAEADVLPAARELGIAFVAYSPLGRSLLANHPQSPKAWT